MLLISPDPERHTPLEDAVGLSAGVILASVGVHIMASCGIVTGQTAGLAFLIAYGFGMPFGAAFLMINLPFYALAISQLGWTFTLRSLASVAALSALTLYGDALLPLQRVDPFIGAVAASAITGVGLLAMFRHRSSLGGVGVLAFYLQDAKGFRAGWTQMIVDAFIFGVALLMLPVDRVAASALGALILNLIIGLNHRRDRYIGR